MRISDKTLIKSLPLSTRAKNCMIGYCCGPPFRNWKETEASLTVGDMRKIWKGLDIIADVPNLGPRTYEEIADLLPDIAPTRIKAVKEKRTDVLRRRIDRLQRELESAMSELQKRGN